MKRTNKQNDSMHQFFKNLAETLNEAGLSMQVVMEKITEVSWTPYSAKEVLWKSVQRPMTGKESTADLTTKEVIAVYNDLHLLLSAHFGINEPFPSTEEQMLQDLSNNPPTYVESI